MVRIHLNDIKAVSQCPAYFALLKKVPRKPISIPVQIIRDTIRRAYVSAMDTGFRISWKNVVSRVDEGVFSNINVRDDGEWKRGKKTSEHVLAFLRHWYHRIYLVEEVVGYADISLTAEVDGYVIAAIAPVIKLGKELTVMRINDIVYTKSQLYNDIEMRGLLWLTSEALGSRTAVGQHLTIGLQGSMGITEINAGNDDHRRVKKAILQASSLIKAGIEFPSVTEKCTVCPFKRRCRL